MKNLKVKHIINQVALFGGTLLITDNTTYETLTTIYSNVPYKDRIKRLNDFGELYVVMLCPSKNMQEIVTSEKPYYTR